MQILFGIILFILGTAFGSFLCCQARRLRLRETKKHTLGARSVCMYCDKKLKWYENLPVISWCIQKGKCRHCGHKIGRLEILSEIATAIALALLSTTVDIATAGPIDWIIFVITLLLTLALIFLALYDGAWGELPTFMLIVSAFLAVILAATRLYADFSIPALTSTLISAAILGGLYLILYLVSKGKWVGDGDWILASIIGLALGVPFLALAALFIANLSATIIMLPRTIKRSDHHIYFGPFLVAAFVITLALCDIINTWV